MREIKNLKRVVLLMLELGEMAPRPRPPKNLKFFVIDSSRMEIKRLRSGWVLNYGIPNESFLTEEEWDELARIESWLEKLANGLERARKAILAQQERWVEPILAELTLDALSGDQVPTVEISKANLTKYIEKRLKALSERVNKFINMPGARSYPMRRFRSKFGLELEIDFFSAFVDARLHYLSTEGERKTLHCFLEGPLVQVHAIELVKLCGNNPRKVFQLARELEQLAKWFQDGIEKLEQEYQSASQELQAKIRALQEIIGCESSSLQDLLLKYITKVLKELKNILSLPARAIKPVELSNGWVKICVKKRPKRVEIYLPNEHFCIRRGSLVYALDWLIACALEIHPKRMYEFCLLCEEVCALAKLQFHPSQSLEAIEAGSDGAGESALGASPSAPCKGGRRRAGQRQKSLCSSRCPRSTQQTTPRLSEN